MDVLSLLPVFSAAEVAVAGMVMGALPARPVAALDAEVAARRVELGAPGFVIMVCKSPARTSNVLASLPAWHTVAVVPPHHQWILVLLASRHFNKFAHPSGTTNISSHIRRSGSISE